MTARHTPLAGFSVFETCKQGLMLLGTHAGVMVRLAAVPFAIVCINALLISQISGRVSPVQNFVYGLPGIAATAWVIFACVRLWLLGETPASLQTDTTTRARLLQTTIVTYALWKALMAGYEQIFLMLANPAELMENPDAFNDRTGVQFAIMVMLGVILWALRFRVAPVLAAVDYPLMDYVRRASGFMISLRYLGLVLMCVEFPKILIVSPLLQEGVPDTLFLVIGNAVTFVLELWLFAAFTVALKTMMGKSRA